jgi:long-chain acyl-CoA synthetase
MALAQERRIDIFRPGTSEETIPGVLFKRVGRFGSRVYVNHFRDGVWQTVTWAEMGEMVTRAASGLVEAGLERGQRVALIAPNRLEWMIADWGIQAAGGITVPIYPTSTSRVVQYICRDADAVIGIAAGDELAAKLPEGMRTVDIDGELQAWLAAEHSQAVRSEVAIRREALRPEDIATFIYTSGTTGDPKGVELTHGNFVDMAGPCCEVFPVTEADVELNWMPLSHVYERMSGTFILMYAGGTTWLSRGQEHLIEDLSIARPTLMCGVPRLWEKVYDSVSDGVRHSSAIKRTLFRWSLDVGRRRLAGTGGPLNRLEHRVADRLVLHPLRTKLTGGRLRCFVSGGAPLNEKVEEFFWLLGVQLLQGYGLTESTSGCTTNTQAEHRYRTVGKAIPGTQIRIAEDGEVLVKGPCVMRGYHDNPQKTAEALTPDGWLMTGDLGFLDSEGYLSITDRKKDLIKTSGGKYVAPLPIEAQLENDRYVKSVIVVGEQRPYCVALIVPDWQALAVDEGFQGDPEKLCQDPALRAFFEPRVNAVNRDLASYETVKYFALLARDFDEAHDELTPSTKIKRRVIAEHNRDVIDSMYEQGTRRPIG